MSIGSQLTPRLRRRVGVTGATVICLYLLSGAVIKVTYGYEHCRELPRSDLAWFRYQMSSFGPIPMSALFGPAFRGYVGDIGNPWAMSGEDEAGMIAPTEAHKRAMRRIIEKSPNSFWAPGAAYGLAQIEMQGEPNPDTIAAYYRGIMVRFPRSIYNEDALQNIARAYGADSSRNADTRRAYEELLQRYPFSRYRSEAYRFLFDSERSAQHLPEALQWAEKWSAVAPVQERFEALIDVVGLRQSTGDMEGASRVKRSIPSPPSRPSIAVFADGSVELSPAQTITRNRRFAARRKLARGR